MSELKKILFATDFSRHADDAFKVACSIATMSGGEVVVLHVVPKSLDYEKMCFEECAVQPFPGESKVFEHIDKSYASTCSVPVRPVIKYGSEPERILELAKAEGVDMIVLGARGVGFLEGLMGGGSVADKVARNTPTSRSCLCRRPVRAVGELECSPAASTGDWGKRRKTL